MLPLEALAIATALRREEPGDQHALRARLVSTDAMTRDFDAPTRRRARIACAFLGAAGRCDIYEIRPLRCRGLHSRDAELCRRQTDHPDLAAAERARQPDPHPAFPLEPVRLADAGLAGLAAVCAERGIAHEPLELMRAVQLLLDDPDRMRGLLDGADGLVEARLDLAARPMAKR